MEQNGEGVKEHNGVDETTRDETSTSSQSSSEGQVISKTEYPLGVAASTVTEDVIPVPNPQLNIGLAIRSTPPPTPKSAPTFTTPKAPENGTQESSLFYTIVVIRKDVPITVPSSAHNMVEVIVGPPKPSSIEPPKDSPRDPAVTANQRVFNVPAGLLTKHSKLFAGLLLVQGKDLPMSHPQSAVYRITLPTTAPNTFAIFLDYMKSWIYNPGLSLKGLDAMRSNGFCWTLGKQLQCPEFRTAALRRLYDLLNPKFRSKNFLPIHPQLLETAALEFMISYTESGSPIRRLYFDTLASNLTQRAAENLAARLVDNGRYLTSDVEDDVRAKYLDFGRTLLVAAGLMDEDRKELLEGQGKYLGEYNLPPRYLESEPSSSEEEEVSEAEASRISPGKRPRLARTPEREESTRAAKRQKSANPKHDRHSYSPFINGNTPALGPNTPGFTRTKPDTHQDLASEDTPMTLVTAIEPLHITDNSTEEPYTDVNTLFPEKPPASPPTDPTHETDSARPSDEEKPNGKEKGVDEGED